MNLHLACIVSGDSVGRDAESEPYRSYAFRFQVEALQVVQHIGSQGGGEVTRLALSTTGTELIGHHVANEP